MIGWLVAAAAAARRGRVAAALLLVALATLGPAAAAPAVDEEPLTAARRSYAKRLVELAASARDAKLGSIALRLYQDAHALDPSSDEARLALGWTRSGTTWSPPNALQVMGEGWPDDGEADLARVVKKEADARIEHVKELFAAASAARAKKDLAGSDRLLWAALAATPDDVNVRRALAHKEALGRWVAPEHATLSVELDARRRSTRDAAGITSEPLFAPVDPPTASVRGWPTPIAKGRQVPGGDAAFGLSPALPLAQAATAADRTRALLKHWLGDPPRPSPIRFLVVPSRDVADALLAADGSVDDTSRETARDWPVWPLGSTGLDLLVADSADAASAVAIDAIAQRDVLVRAKDTTAARWIAFAMGWVASATVLGVPRGYGTTIRVTRGDTGPAPRVSEGAAPFVRRLVALGADRPMRDVATVDPRTLRPRDIAKAGALLDWLFLADAARARDFVSAILEAAGGPAAAIDAAAKAAGFASVEALEEAWRRFTIDAVAPPSAVGADGGAWKVTKLEPLKALPAAESIYGPLVHTVAGSLWLGGRPYTAKPVDDGQAVALYPLQAGKPDRVVRAPGVYPFTVAAEFGAKTGKFVEFHAALARDGASWTVRAADAMTGAIDGHLVTFLDVDCDGRWGGFHRDGYVAGKGAYVLPLRRELVLGSKTYEIRRVGPDGREAAWRARPLGAKGSDLEALVRVNGWRTTSGLSPLLWDDAAAARAKEKEPPAGARVVAVPKASGAGAKPLSAVESAALVAFGARVGLDPDPRAVGWAFTSERLVVVASQDDAGPPSAFRGPVIVPGSGAEGIPTTDGAAPFPMSVTFASGTDLAAVDCTATLALEAGTPVDVELRTPADRPGTVFVVPRGGLGRHTPYRLTVGWGPPASRTTRVHIFTTGE